MIPAVQGQYYTRTKVRSKLGPKAGSKPGQTLDKARSKAGFTPGLAQDKTRTKSGLTLKPSLSECDHFESPKTNLSH